MYHPLEALLLPRVVERFLRGRGDVYRGVLVGGAPDRRGVRHVQAAHEPAGGKGFACTKQTRWTLIHTNKLHIKTRLHRSIIEDVRNRRISREGPKGRGGNGFFLIQTIHHRCCTTVHTEKLHRKFRRHRSSIMDFKMLGILAVFDFWGPPNLKFIEKKITCCK